MGGKRNWEMVRRVGRVREGKREGDRTVLWLLIGNGGF